MAQPPPQNVAPTTAAPGTPPMPPIPPRPGSGAPGANGPASAARSGPGAGPLNPSQIAALQQPGAEGEVFENEVSIHHSFWQQPWVQDILPFVTSLALHAAIVIIGLLLYAAGKQIASMVPLEEQIVIPEAAMANEMAGGVENPGLGDPTRAAAQDKYDENTTPDGSAFERSDNSVAEAAGGGEGDASNALIGGGTSSFGAGNKFGTGEGDGTGAGTGSGKGRLAPFGAPGGGIPGPRGKVFGNGGNARTIAFCCDSSGSMIDKFQNLKAELSKAIEGLKPIQQFSIVFFADEKFHAFEGGALVSATTDNKRKANKWLDELTTSGTSNPIPGLQAAFKGRPELMYILTDGDFPNNDAVISKVAQLNAGKRTRINTIAFSATETDEQSESFLKFLGTLADQNGGKFKAVSQDQLD